MPSKSKTKPYGVLKTPAQTFGIYFQRNNGSFTGYDYPQNVPIDRRIGSASSIRYETGKDGRFRPCVHSSDSYYVVPVPGITLSTRPMPGFYTPTNPTAFKEGFHVNGVRSCHQRYYAQFIKGIGSAPLSLGTINWSSLAQTALENMMPSFGGANSLVNFILELKDFREAARYITSDVSKKLNLLEALFSFRRSDKPMKKLSKAYLSYSFGWRPLFNDIVKLWETLTDFERKMKRLKLEADTDLQKHFSVTVNGSSLNATTYRDAVVQPQSDGYGGAASSYRYRVILDATDGVRYNATLRYRYPLPPELSGAWGRVKALLDTLGVQANPAIIWNAIPFSFVVDWVINVNAWLNRLRVDNIRFQTEIRDFCHSAVITRNVRYEWQWASSSKSASNVTTLYWGDWLTTDQASIRRYERRRGIPDFGAALQTSGLNAREFSLSAALMHANTGKPGRK